MLMWLWGCDMNKPADHHVQIWASGKGMIRLLFEGRVVGFAADLRAAAVKQAALQKQLLPRG